jgi:hypothetical protein
MSAGNPIEMGNSDGLAAVAAARKEGFPKRAIIFLDQEEGGRLLPPQREYLHSWIDKVDSSGFRAGVYCSGIPFREATGAQVITAEDIREHAGRRNITYFVSNDACGPSPGCVFPEKPPSPAASGVRFADVWQFAQSPRRNNMTASCARTYHSDGSCYAPGFTPEEHLHVDVSTAISNDPSQGRTGGLASAVFERRD